MMRLNLGCGAYRMRPAAGDGWTDWDEDPGAPADRHVRVPPIDLPDERVAEVYMGHLLEHLEPPEADELLRECLRVLVPRGRLGVVVPDTRAVLAHYLARDHEVVQAPQGHYWNLDDLDGVCAWALYSTVQPSRHRWSYDEDTLPRALSRAGFAVLGRIPPDDPRLAVPSWWDLGYDASKPEASG